MPHVAECWQAETDSDRNLTSLTPVCLLALGKFAQVQKPHPQAGGGKGGKEGKRGETKFEGVQKSDAKMACIPSGQVHSGDVAPGGWSRCIFMLEALPTHRYLSEEGLNS